MFDVILYGATGFTGGLVAEHFHKTYGNKGELRWTIAGRDLNKLENVAKRMGADYLDCLTADANKPETLTQLTQKTKVIISTVGPYTHYGEPLLKACIDQGIGYVDLCGETGWMREMILRYEARARETGARIIFSCGYDSLPFDVGVYLVQKTSMARYQQPAMRVRARIRGARGEMSGGTVASGLASIERAAQDAEYKAQLNNPFALTPGYEGPVQPDGDQPRYDEVVRSWVTPFVMATINTKNIHRSNFVQNHAYGSDFLYDEMEMTGDGDAGEQRAHSAAKKARLTNKILNIKFLRHLLKRFVPIKPGDGPDQSVRENGYYDILFIGHTKDQQQVVYALQGDLDPGYGATAGFLGESGVCLAIDFDEREIPGGMWTCVSAMGERLIERLSRHAEIRFIEDAAIQDRYIKPAKSVTNS